MITFFVDTLELAAPMSVMIAALLLISPLIKKSFVAKWRYFMWLFVAARLILPFKISVFDKPITVEIPERISGMTQASETVINGGAVQQHMTLQTALMLIWLVGMAVFAAIQLVSYFTFRKRVNRWAAPITDNRTIEIFNEIKKSLDERRSLKFMSCKAISTPMVFGFIRPTLLLPDDEYSEGELRVILRHEMVHFKRNDIWYKLVLMTANCINWFNPFVYMMVHAANKDIELACDAEVVRGRDMEYRRGYCMAILTVVHNKRQPAAPLSTCFIISRKVIKERFGDILDLRKKRKGIVMFAVVALSIIVSGSIVTFGAEKAAEVMEEELNIIERPAPKPRVTETPVPSAAPRQTSSAKPTAVPAVTAAPVIITAAPTAEPTAPPVYTAAPVYDDGRTRVDLSQQSNLINMQFKGEGDAHQSATSFTAADGMDMVVVADDECLVQIVNDATGEVVGEQPLTKENGIMIVPVSGGEYSVNAIGTENSREASLYIYGK